MPIQETFSLEFPNYRRQGRDGDLDDDAVFCWDIA
jgi:hypothetical protein